MRVPEALETLAQEEATQLIDQEAATREAIRRVEQSGIVFLDEIDKIAGREGVHGPDVSREGVQRDLLPIVEGSTVSTRSTARCAPTTCSSSRPARSTSRSRRT